MSSYFIIGKIDGVEHEAPVNSIADLHIEVTSKYIQLDSSSGVRVQFDGRTRATVCVPEDYSGKKGISLDVNIHVRYIID